MGGTTDYVSSDNSIDSNNLIRLAEIGYNSPTIQKTGSTPLRDRIRDANTLGKISNQSSGNFDTGTANEMVDTVSNAITNSEKLQPEKPLNIGLGLENTGNNASTPGIGLGIEGPSAAAKAQAAQKPSGQGELPETFTMRDTTKPQAESRPTVVDYKPLTKNQVGQGRDINQALAEATSRAIAQGDYRERTKENQPIYRERGLGVELDASSLPEKGTLDSINFVIGGPDQNASIPFADLRQRGNRDTPLEAKVENNPDAQPRAPTQSEGINTIVSYALPAIVNALGDLPSITSQSTAVEYDPGQQDSAAQADQAPASSTEQAPAADTGMSRESMIRQEMIGDGYDPIGTALLLPELGFKSALKPALVTPQLVKQNKRG